MMHTHNGELLIFLGHDTNGMHQWAPISQRPQIPDFAVHNGVPPGARAGDIIESDLAQLPLVVIDGRKLDDGSGTCSFVHFQNRRYRIIGSVYESIEPLISWLENNFGEFNREAYGMK